MDILKGLCGDEHNLIYVKYVNIATGTFTMTVQFTTFIHGEAEEAMGEAIR